MILSSHDILKRWYKLKFHQVQHELMTDSHRFKVVAAGRRSGKTENAKRFVVRQASRIVGDYFVAAPTRDQVKKIYWDDLKALCFSNQLPKAPSESTLIIFLPNGSRIHLIGLDKPSRIEGIPWKGGVIDEIADVKADAWQANILPALNTVTPLDPDYRAWCWLIGVPEGRNHFYDIAEYARTSNDPDWKFYTWKSIEILPADLIEAQRRALDPRTFRQEFEAAFETSNGVIYYNYDPTLNSTTEEIEPHEQLLWCHDFNFTPLSSCVVVVRANRICVLDEIVLTSAISKQSALEFVEKYQHHKNKNVIIYGDPVGRAGEKHGHNSDYTEMEQILRQNGWTVTRKVKNKAPAIKDRQNAVRAKICSSDNVRSLFVNTSKCYYVNKGLCSVEFKEGSTFLEEETDYQHITTALGYYIDYEFPIRVEKDLSNIKPIASVNYF